MKKLHNKVMRDPDDLEVKMRINSTNDEEKKNFSII